MISTGAKASTAELLFARAKQLGLRPAWLTRKGLFVVTTNSGEKYINFARSTLNSDVSASLAKDKYLTRLILKRHKLPNIPYAHPTTNAEAQDFLVKHSKIIVKPLRGSGSQHIQIVEQMDQLATLDVSKYIFEKYIIGKEMRYLVLDNAVVAVYQSEYGDSVEVTRNLQCISYPQIAWDPKLITLSVQVADILGLQFAAVDYLIDAKNQAYVLEVNSTPDLKWFHAPTTGPPVDVAQLFFQAMLAKAH